jgi:ATP-dependent Clp protease ATP-binding subunit ClpA
MNLDSSDARFVRARDRLSAYARDVLERAGLHALRLHADAVTPEHLLSTLMDDAASGAAAVVRHAFADPETIADEALAISPGVMVVGSGSTLPFSPLGLRALVAARSAAAAQGDAEVDERHLLRASTALLTPELQGTVRDLGVAIDSAGGSLGSAESPSSSTGPAGRPRVIDAGPLFKSFSTGAKRALSIANHVAAGAKHTAISPAHILIACLKNASSASSAATFARVRAAVEARAADATPLEPRPIPADPVLVEFLAGVEPPAGTIELLAHYLDGSTPELAAILIRHKVTRELVARVRSAFADPAGDG